MKSSVYVCECFALQRPKRALDAVELQIQMVIADGHEPPYGNWEENLGTREDHSIFVAAGPSLQPIRNI